MDTVQVAGERGRLLQLLRQINDRRRALAPAERSTDREVKRLISRALGVAEGIQAAGGFKHPETIQAYREVFRHHLLA